MIFDPWGLGYTRHGNSLAVHYPVRAADGTMVRGAGAAMHFDHAPELTRSPDSERSTLWRNLLAARSSSGEQA